MSPCNTSESDRGYLFAGPVSMVHHKGKRRPMECSVDSHRPFRPVMCVETGEVYPSTKAATEAMGLKSTASIWEAVAHGKTAAGYNWIYVDNSAVVESNKADELASC
eukprot:g3803.t1